MKKTPKDRPTNWVGTYLKVTIWLFVTQGVRIQDIDLLNLNGEGNQTSFPVRLPSVPHMMDCGC